MDEILQSLVPIMKKEMPKHPPTNENLSDYFFSRVRKNLHIILCFSPVRFCVFHFQIKDISSINSKSVSNYIK